MAADTIDKEINLSPGKDFNALLAIAIAKIKQLAGNTWTDYNEHDPGITILEQLAYGLTEVGYKADLPITDLLCAADGSIAADDNFFFTAAKILTVNPININDYRKLLIDHFPGINNAWITVAQTAEGVEMTGYNVLASLKNMPADEEIAGQEDLIKQFLNSNRNLAEQFLKVTILKPLLIGVKGKFQVRHGADPEKLMENILLSLKDLINPAINLYTVADRMDAGDMSQDIFCGPAAVGGYIRDEDLCDKITEIKIPQVLKAIMSLADVTNVDDIGILVNGQPASSTSIISIAGTEVAMFDADTTINGIQLFSKDILLSPITKYVQANYYGKKSGDKSPYALNTPANQLDLPMPAGNYTDVETYYSIKNQFPDVYGLGEKNSQSLSAERQAQINQLKGYLAFFDQHLADSLSQLANARYLFNFKAAGKVNYLQTIAGYEGMDKLLDANYLKEMDAILNIPEKALPQTDQMLTHVLARFSEVVGVYNFDEKHKLDEAAFSDSGINLKLGLLRSFAKYSSTTAQAPGFGLDDNQQLLRPITSGMEIKMQQFLGDDDKKFAERFFVIEHSLFAPSADDYIPAAFFDNTISCVFILTEDKFKQDNYKQYLTEMTGHICPAHLLPHVIFLDPQYKDVIADFKQLFTAWATSTQSPETIIPGIDAGGELASFIYNNLSVSNI